LKQLKGAQAHEDEEAQVHEDEGSRAHPSLYKSKAIPSKMLITNLG